MTRTRSPGPGPPENARVPARHQNAHITGQAVWSRDHAKRSGMTWSRRPLCKHRCMLAYMCRFTCLHKYGFMHGVRMHDHCPREGMSERTYARARNINSRVCRLMLLRTCVLRKSAQDSRRLPGGYRKLTVVDLKENSERSFPTAPDGSRVLQRLPVNYTQKPRKEASNARIRLPGGFRSQWNPSTWSITKNSETIFKMCSGVMS